MEIEVTGPKVFWVLPWDLPDTTIFTMKNLITQTTLSLCFVTIVLVILACVLTKKITKRPGKIQVLLEKIVTMLYNLVESTMGKHNLKFAPYIGTLFASSIFGSLIGMTGIFRSSTADLSVTLAWALVTTGLVWANNIKNFGFKTWLKGFTEPIFIMTPMNIISGLIGQIPFFQAGIPAVLSVYFDLFSGFVQALVFSLLTMVYVSGASPAPEELPEDRQAILKAKEEKKLRRAKH